MTSRLWGALRRAALPAVLAAALLPIGVGSGTGSGIGFGFGTSTAYAATTAPTAVTALTAPAAPTPSDPSPSPSASAPYYGTGSLAGSRAGEGRQRPGRAEPGTVPDPAVWRPLPPPPREVRPERPRPTPVLPPPPGTADAPRERAAEGPAFPGLRVLPLGAGMVLIGFGLGFLGLRLRRG
ncbi:hypothetical protein [Streptomyces aureoverticillatus]|uniref:hypothetical protein n=1 Tax=Streptomyces aureoverticillatus TaxID=66871 RepID=UPI0013DB54AF|nr:hypothetical protein [Streptomyces aureoverticillatus]QIB44665.1 hypothetical protein G3H79_17835 [Streptomyces aureoverticillatus]